MALYPIRLALGITFPLRIEIHVAGGRFRSFFAEVEKVHLAVGLAQQHETAPANISCLGVNDGQREASSHGGIDGVPALPQDVCADLRSLLVNAHHHGLAGVDWSQALGVAQLSRARQQTTSLKDQKFA